VHVRELDNIKTDVITKLSMQNVDYILINDMYKPNVPAYWPITCN